MIDVIVFFIVLLYCWLFSSLCCCDLGYIILLESYTVWKILCSQNFFQVLPVFRDLWDKVPFDYLWTPTQLILLHVPEQALLKGLTQACVPFKD